MNEPTTKYAAFVMPELSKTRLDAQWARIAEQRPTGQRGGKRHLVPAVGLLVAAAAAFAVVWWPREVSSPIAESPDSVWEGSVVASDDAPVDMTLAEGTHIKVEPRSEVKLLHSSQKAVKVRLGHGSARFHVAKKRTRRFSVDLGGVEVVVTGTQFRVLRRASPGGDRMHVDVQEGSVEVHREGGGVVTLGAGEHWSGVVPRTPNADAPDTTDEPELDAAGDDPLDLEIGEDEIDENERTARRHRRERRHRRREAASDAEELFDHANLARRAGRLEDAADLYDDLVDRYPQDRRASLAAFELGRLRMDSLRDVGGAVQALERALKLDSHGAFAEDALARLVLAEEERGDHRACNRARTRYLARYPEGVHAQHVAERCGGN